MGFGIKICIGIRESEGKFNWMVLCISKPGWYLMLSNFWHNFMLNFIFCLVIFSIAYGKQKYNKFSYKGHCLGIQLSELLKCKSKGNVIIFFTLQ